MNREESIKKLEELKTLPICKVEDIFDNVSDFNEEEVDKLNKYLEKFVKPSITNGDCVMCNKSLYLEWGIAHGSATCGNCGIGVKVYHYYKDIGIEKEGRIEKILQSHGNCYDITE